MSEVCKSSDVLKEIIVKAKSDKKKIVLPGSSDSRILKATEIILRDGIADIVLLTKDKSEMVDRAKKLELDISKATVIEYSTSSKLDEYAKTFHKLREKKGMTYEKALETMKDSSLYFGAMMLRNGEVDGMVAGSLASTADVLRASLQVIGAKEGVKTISSCFLMELPTAKYGDKGLLIFGDCGVIPTPTDEQLADIAISSVETARTLAHINPKVAMLSFSTMGSASHPDVETVANSVKILKERKVDFEFDGELQADAALVPSVAESKAPLSHVAGKANVLIFPNLGAGNIGYKLVERLGNAKAYGPVLQGLAKPVNDLSRGCNIDNIVNVVAITSVLANK